MFRYTDEPRQTHPSDRLDTLNDALIALAVSSAACGMFGLCIFMGWL